MKHCAVFLLFLATTLPVLGGSTWQWSAEIKRIVSTETSDHPCAYLWIPENCKQVRGVVLGQHNMTEEGLLEHPYFRQAMTELGFAEVWITPGIDMAWDVANGVQQTFEELMNHLATLSGYGELAFAPIVPIGHSAMATYPWNFAAWNPQRTLALLSIHGDSPQTKLTGYGGKNLDWGTRTIEGIPSLLVMGEYEWWEDRLLSAFAYRHSNPDAPLSMLADAGHGHFDCSDSLVRYMSLFLTKVAQHRLPKEMPLDKPATLIPIDATDGYLVDRWRRDANSCCQAAPYKQYKGDISDAFWYFDKEMAEATERYYAVQRGKREQYIGFMQQGQLLAFNPQSHARINIRFEPDADGLTFHAKALFTDTLRNNLSKDHAAGAPAVSRICGPVEIINDSTFTVRFYRMGLNNIKRTSDIWLLAAHDGDSKYKSSVQQVNTRIPHRNTEGEEQTIDFPALKGISRQQAIPGSIYKNALKATASSRMPVYYYIKQGPAQLINGELTFTQIPPRTKFPIKVTVVAWQYGRGVTPLVQTAPAVERSFMIDK